MGVHKAAAHLEPLLQRLPARAAPVREQRRLARALAEQPRARRGRAGRLACTCAKHLGQGLPAGGTPGTQPAFVVGQLTSFSADHVFNP